jgi:hypothetical protein
VKLGEPPETDRIDPDDRTSARRRGFRNTPREACSRDRDRATSLWERNEGHDLSPQIRRQGQAHRQFFFDPIGRSAGRVATETSETVKQTRKVRISEKVFTAADLLRLAKVVDIPKDGTSRDHVLTVFKVKFSNETVLESDTSDVLQEESLTAYDRPIGIEMSYSNITKQNYMSVSLSHGEHSFGNEASVSGADITWVNANFQLVQDALRAVRPQHVWVRRHETLLLNLIALGIGSAGFLMFDLVGWLIFKAVAWRGVVLHPPSLPLWLSSLLPVLEPAFVIFNWLWRWVLGLSWGAFAVRDWLLALWPSIEFDFGQPHRQAEKIKRQRLYAVVSLIVLPIVASLLYDLLKTAF